jgi:hypothetical protein
VEDTQTDPSVLVVGLNPGEERILAGKIAMFASAVAPLLSPILGTGCMVFLLYCIFIVHRSDVWPTVRS